MVKLNEWATSSWAQIATYLHVLVTIAFWKTFAVVVADALLAAGLFYLPGAVLCWEFIRTSIKCWIALDCRVVLKVLCAAAAAVFCWIASGCCRVLSCFLAVLEPSSRGQHTTRSWIGPTFHTSYDVFCVNILFASLMGIITRPWRETYHVPAVFLLLRGAIVNRTYGTHKNVCISLFLPTIFGPIYYGSP